MRKNILLLSAILLCWISTSCAEGIYDKGVYWTVDKDDKIVNKNGYPPDAELLEDNNQRSIYTAEDIPFGKAEYKNGKVIRHIKTQQEIQAEVEVEEKATEFEVIYKRMKKLAIDQLVAEGYIFKYDHLEH